MQAVQSGRTTEQVCLGRPITGTYVCSLTRSKPFTPPSGEARVDDKITSEHLRFQTVLKWLWDRHDEVCEKAHTASRRPEWVSTALAPCSSCLLGNRGEE